MVHLDQCLLYESLGGTSSVSSDPPISAIPSPIIANRSSIIILFKQIKITLHISLLTSCRYKIENISHHTRIKNTTLRNLNIIIGCKYIENEISITVTWSLISDLILVCQTLDMCASSWRHLNQSTKPEEKTKTTWSTWGFQISFVPLKLELT